MASEAVGGTKEPEKGENDFSEGLSEEADRANGAARTQSAVKESGEQRERDGHWFNIPITDLTEDERTCIQFIISEYGRHHEVWLKPMLDNLPKALPTLADWQRKSLISDLEYKGAFCLEKRSAIPYDYTVLILNYNHPVVREMC